MTAPAPPSSTMPSPTATINQDWQTLADFLSGKSSDLPALDLLREHHLAAYAYTQCPADSAYKAALRADFMQATARHQIMKAELQPLLRAWQEAGITVLLLKGFYLAEFVYKIPGQRFHGDIDMLIDPAQADEAAKRAQALGWQITFRAEDSISPYSHELMQMRSPRQSVFLEVQRRGAQNYFPCHAVQQRLSEALWQASQLQRWPSEQGDVFVRLPCPEDAVLLGLVLNRAWSADAWRLRSHDYLDFAQLVEHFALSLEALQARARLLGVTKSLACFMQRCNPYREQLDMRPPTPWQQQRWDVQVMQERPHPSLERLLGKLWRLPAALRDTLRELPGLLRVAWVLQRQSDVYGVLERLVPSTTSPEVTLSLHQRQRIVRGVRWGLRLLRIRPGHSCLPRSLAIAARLRAMGAAAQFVSGIRREGAALLGHAWVELDGRVLDELHEPNNPQRYRVNLRFPSAAEDNPGEAALAFEQLDWQ